MLHVKSPGLRRFFFASAALVLVAALSIIPTLAQALTPDGLPSTQVYVSHTLVCGQVTLTFHNNRNDILPQNPNGVYAFEYRVDGEPQVRPSPWYPGDGEWHVVNVPHESSEVRTFTFTANSGNHSVEYRLKLGPESDFFFNWQPAIVVSTDCTPCTTACYVDAVNGNDAAFGNAISPKKTIQAAITQVSPGGTVYVADGTYAENLTVSGKSLSLIGESRAGVIINAATAASDGFLASTGNFTFMNFTMNGLGATGAYGLKVSGAATSAVVEDVTVNNFFKSQLDFNGLVSLSLKNIEAKNADWGNGVALQDVKNAVLNGITTSGNAWGGVRVGSQGRYYPPGTNGVQFLGMNSFAELLPVYVELNYWALGYLPVLNVSVPGFEWAKTNFRAGTGEKQWWLFVTEEAANAATIEPGSAGGSMQHMQWPMNFYYPPSSIYVESFTKHFSTGGPFKVVVPVSQLGVDPHRPAAVQFIMEYDPACLVPDGAPTLENGDQHLEVVKFADGQLQAGIWGLDASNTLVDLEDGVMMNVPFVLAPACQTADSTTLLNFSGADLSCSDALGVPMACVTLDGALHIDVNEVPTNLSLSNNHVPENVAGAPVGNLSVTDSDGDGPVYSMDTACLFSNNSLFEIVGNQLKLKATTTFDFEHLPTLGYYVACVKADDLRGGIAQNTFLIYVDDVNDNAPVVTSLTGAIDEDMPSGTKITDLTATDVDTVNGTRTYELSGGCTPGTFSNGQVQVVGSELQSTSAYNFEQPLHSFNACVVAKDGANTSAAAIVVVTVNDANETATDITISQSEWAEQVPLGATGAAFTTIGDPDAGSSFTYELVSGVGGEENSRFSIVGNALHVVDSSLEAGTYRILVSSTDNGAPTITIERPFILTVFGTASLSMGSDTSGHGGIVRQVSGALTYQLTYEAPQDVATVLSFEVAYDKLCLAVTASAGTPGDGFIAFSYTNPTAATVAPTFSVTALASCPDSRVGSSTPALSEAKSLSIENVVFKKDSLELSYTKTPASVTVIDNSVRGNCNADAAQGVNAADYVATVLEIFDADGTSWLNAPTAGFDGSPYGCDSNKSTTIEAADIVCTVHESFASTCGAAQPGWVEPASMDAAVLNMAAASVDAGAMVNIPVSFDAQGASIGALVFTLKLDPAKAAFDAADADGDGNPDAIHFNLADGQSAMAIYDAAAGTIHVAVFSVTAAMQPINGNVASVDLKSLAGGDAGLVIESASASTVDGVEVPVSGAMGGQNFLPDRFFNYLPVLVR